MNERWRASPNHERMEAMRKTKPADKISTDNGLSYSIAETLYDTASSSCSEAVTIRRWLRECHQDAVNGQHSLPRAPSSV